MKIENCGPFTEVLTAERKRRAKCDRCGAHWKPAFPEPVKVVRGDGSCGPNGPGEEIE